MFSYPAQRQIRQCLSRIDAMRNVDVSRIRKVAYERGRPTCHVGRKEWGCRAQPHAPSRASRASYVSFGRTRPFGFSEESVDSLPFSWV